MKLIEKGPGLELQWVGRLVTCPGCASTYELEIGDAVMTVRLNGVLTFRFTCPGCQSGMRLTEKAE